MTRTPSTSKNGKKNQGSSNLDNLQAMGYYRTMKEKFTIEEIKNAVDIVIGDAGMRSKEVIEILKQEKENVEKRSK